MQRRILNLIQSTLPLVTLLGFAPLALAEKIYVEPMHLMSESGKVEPDKKFTKYLVGILKIRGFHAEVLESPLSAPLTKDSYIVKKFVQTSQLLDYPPCGSGLPLEGTPSFSASLQKPDGQIIALKEVTGSVSFERDEVRCPQSTITESALQREVEVVLVKLANQISDVVTSN